MTKMEVQDIMNMECDAFEESLQQELDVPDLTEHDLLRAQLAELDGTGVSTAVVEAMQDKLRECAGPDQEEILEEQQEETLNEEIAELQQETQNPDRFWQKIDKNLKQSAIKASVEAQKKRARETFDF